MTDAFLTKHILLLWLISVIISTLSELFQIRIVMCSFIFFSGLSLDNEMRKEKDRERDKEHDKERDFEREQDHERHKHEKAERREERRMRKEKSREHRKERKERREKRRESHKEKNSEQTDFSDLEISKSLEPMTPATHFEG